MSDFVANPKAAPPVIYADKVRRYADSLEGRQEIMKLVVAEGLWSALERTHTSRAELARRAGVSPQYITKIFRGTTNFTLESMVALFHHVGHELEISAHPKAEAADHQAYFQPMVLRPEAEKRFRPYVAESALTGGGYDSALAA